MTVSIVMCTYNGARFLREQMDSLLAQTYPLHEIIVQDDGSTDDTMEILSQYAKSHVNIHVFSNQGTHGVNHNFISAMHRATGDLIAICDQDDIWAPDKVERQVRAIGHHLLTGGQTMQFSGDGSAVSAPDHRLLNHHILRLLFVSMMPGHSMLLRRQLINHLSPTRPFYYDTQLQVIASALGSLNAEKEVHVMQRRYEGAVTYAHPTENTRTPLGMLRYLWQCLRIYRKTRPLLRERMQAMQQMIGQLKETDNLAPSAHLALRMTELQQARGPIAYLRLTLFCYRHRQHLFHTQERDTLSLRLRALLYPITTAYYFRHSV